MLDSTLQKLWNIAVIGTMGITSMLYMTNQTPDISKHSSAATNQAIGAEVHATNPPPAYDQAMHDNWEMYCSRVATCPSYEVFARWTTANQEAVRQADATARANSQAFQLREAQAQQAAIQAMRDEYRSCNLESRNDCVDTEKLLRSNGIAP